MFQNNYLKFKLIFTLLMKLFLLKITAFLLVCTYVFINIGFPVIEHYCAGELEEVALFSKPINCCGEEKEITKDDGCCKNKTTYVAFHKDFTLKIAVNHPVKVYLEFTPRRFTKNNTERFFETLKHVISLPKEPPPKLLQKYLVEFSVIRV